MITIEKPSPPALVAEMAPIVAAAREFNVVDIETDRIAQERGQILRRAERSGEDHFAKAKKSASDAHKMIVAAVASMVGPWAEARTIYFRKSDEYQAAERVKAEAEQRRLQERARKEEEERQLLAAIDAEEGGNQAEAEAILAERPSVPVVTVAPAVAEVKGVSRRTTWSAEVDDLLKLVRYVAQHEEWISLLEPAMPNLNRLAVAQREALSIPGVRAVATQVRSTRS
jgi:hypothetical protein